MQAHHQQAFLLHRKPYTESSLLLDVFTREHGRLTVLAKGARRLKSPFRGLIHLFKPLTISFTGKGQLPILTNVENGPYVTDLRHQYLACGFYLNELVMKFLQRYDAHESLFDAYSQALSSLQMQQDANRVLRIFEKQLLRDIGFGIVLDHDIDTGKPIEHQHDYHYIPERGPALAIIQDERLLKVRGATLTSLHEEQLSEKTHQNEARKLTRVLIDHQLRGKEIRSRSIMHAMLKYRR